MVLFTDNTVLWLFTVHMVCSILSTSFTYWKRGVFFSVMTKSLALVTSETVWDVYFNFSHSISYFHFGRRFLGY